VFSGRRASGRARVTAELDRLASSEELVAPRSSRDRPGRPGPRAPASDDSRSRRRRDAPRGGAARGVARPAAGLPRPAAGGSTLPPRDRRADAGPRPDHDLARGRLRVIPVRPNPERGASVACPLAYLATAGGAFVLAAVALPGLGAELAGHYYHPRLL